MPVGFRTVLSVTVDPDAPPVGHATDWPALGDVPMITVDTSPCRIGDLIVVSQSQINTQNIDYGSAGTGTPPAGLTFSGNLTENLAAGVEGLGNAALWYVTAPSPDPLYGYLVSGADDGNPGYISVAAVAACYSESTTSGDHLLHNVRYNSSGGPSSVTVDSSLGFPSPLILPPEGALFTGQVLANQVTTFGTVNAPFTLRASAVGRYSPVLARYPQVQIGDLLDTGGGGSSFDPTWNNTNTGVTALDYHFHDPDTFTVEGIGAWLAMSQFTAAPSTGLHVWQTA